MFFYTAGSSTKTNVYKDNAANTAWTNPIVLDSGGNLPSGGEVWFQGGVTYKVVFAPANDTDPPGSPYWTKDTLSGINDVAAQIGSEWISGPTPSFVGTTVFSVAGDQRTTFTVGRRVKTTNTAGTVYSTVFSSAFTGALTNVTVINDSTVLDTGLSAVSYGILASVNQSIPNVLTNTFRIADLLDPTKTGSFTVSSVASSSNVNVNFPSMSGNMAMVAYLSPGVTGLQLANSATSNAMDITGGFAIDRNFGVFMSTAAINNKTMAAFSTGASTGAKLSAAAISTNTWYAWYLIGNITGGVDVGFDTAFPPNTPTTTGTFPFFQYIGGRKTSATTTWVATVQHGDDVYWTTPPAVDVSGVAATSARAIVRANVPPQVVKWYGHVSVLDQAASDAAVYLSDPSQADVAPAVATTPLATISFQTQSGTIVTNIGGQASVWTSSSGSIGVRGLAAQNTEVQTIGWMDPRGKPVS